MTLAPAFTLFGALALARGDAPASAGIEDASVSSPVPGMPDPLSSEWDPPPGPAPKHASTVGDAWVDEAPHPGTRVTASPTAARKSTLPEPLPEPQHDARWSRRVLFTGLGFAIAGAVSGSVAYYASTKANKARERLDTPAFPGEMQPDRGELRAEVEKQQTIMLATTITAAVLGATGIALMLVGALYKPSPRRRVITKFALAGVGFSF